VSLTGLILLLFTGLIRTFGSAAAQPVEPGQTSYLKVDFTQSFTELRDAAVAAKPGVEAAHNAVLNQRYDLSDRPAAGVVMERAKPVQDGIRVKLPAGQSWDSLAALTPTQIRDQNLWPQGFLPLPHVNQPVGGFMFPQFVINQTKLQDGRNLQRFDLDYDLPDQFLAEFPPGMYLTPHTEMGDVTGGVLLTLNNYFEKFNGFMTPRQLEGLRLLLTPFAQQQYNVTEDRKTELPSTGATCFDCHSNGHQNGAAHLTPDARPEAFRHRTKTLSLRGVNVQRLFGSQRALKTVEDFTEFEQRVAYFDGDIVIAEKKGVNPLVRGTQVERMADLQAMLTFPPNPKLDVLGRLDPAVATPAELRGQDIFNGKGQCASCHPAPYFTDNSMHDLQTGRFFNPTTINNMVMVNDGPIKTFALRAVKDNPPYMHDQRLLTLDDTIEFFNLILGTKLATPEKQDLLAFLRAI
jgi:cytochrome c peroxidase